MKNFFSRELVLYFYLIVYPFLIFSELIIDFGEDNYLSVITRYILIFLYISLYAYFSSRSFGNSYKPITEDDFLLQLTKSLDPKLQPGSLILDSTPSTKIIAEGNRVWELVRSFRDGFFQYHIPTNMIQGKTYDISCEIASESSIFFEVDRLNLQEISIDRIMQVDLTSDKSFEITSLNTGQQAVFENKKTQWSWKAKPLTSGKVFLVFTIKVILSVENNPELPFYIPAIEVLTDIKRSISFMFKKNMKWIIATLLAIGVFIIELLGLLNS